MRCAKVWVSCDSSALVGAFTRRKRGEPSQRSTYTPSSNSMWSDSVAWRLARWLHRQPVVYVQSNPLHQWVRVKYSTGVRRAPHCSAIHAITGPSWHPVPGFAQSSQETGRHYNGHGFRCALKVFVPIGWGVHLSSDDTW